MKLSDLKKEILLALFSECNGGERLRPFSVDMVVHVIEKRRPSLLFKPPYGNPLNFVCVQRSLERLVRDGLLYVERSRKPSLHSYFLSPRGTRKARRLKTEIRNYMFKWENFVEY